MQVDWHSPEILRIAIQRENGDVDLYSIKVDEAGLPRIDSTNKLTITYGEDEVEVIKESQSESSQANGNSAVKLSTF